ncbi:MAG: Adenylosuccinate synthetase [Bacteroidetes bacterium ADurb.Bin408]|nr:MAG: Adenylosuccinate synthetase [Bacteroidetes bacterium ADurb.Bin408]
MIKVAQSYNNQTLDYLPFNIDTAPVTPDYTELQGWNVPVDNLQSSKDLPEELLAYIKFIENYVHVPVSFLSLGPDRKQTYQL